MNMNKLTVVGRLTRDVELKDVNGRQCASFGVASQNKHFNKETQKYDSNFYTVTAWGKTAEIASQYLKRGHRVGVAGDLIYREYIGTDQKNHGVLEINNAEIDLVETATEAGKTQAAAAPAQAPAQAYAQAPAQTYAPAPAQAYAQVPAQATAPVFSPVETYDSLPF